MNEQYGNKREFLDRITKIHMKLQGLDRDDARIHFIREACDPQHPHHLHLYRLKRKKQPSSQVILVLCNKGLDIYEVI